MPADPDDPPPPPPATGTTVSWQRNAQGLRAAPQPASVPPAADTAGVPIPEPSSVPPRPAGEPTAPTPAPGDTPTPNPTLPPPAPPWPFRQSLVEVSDKAARALTEALGQKDKPAAVIIERLLQAVCCHPTIYRRAAETPSWMHEACWLVGAVIVGTTLWYLTYLFSAYGPGLFFILKTIVLRAAAWVSVVFAIQLAAKSLHQADLPFEALFRALAYASAASVLATVPIIGPIFGLWGLACSVAAIMDTAGVDLAKAIVLLIIGAVSAAIVAVVLGAVLL